MHKQREEDRASGAARKPSAEDEFDSRVRESEVRTRYCSSAVSCKVYLYWAVFNLPENLTLVEECLFTC